jgi:virginiamycin B lyase
MRRAVLVLLALPVSVCLGQPARQAGSPHSDTQLWTTPYDASARVRDAFGAPDGKVWFVGQMGNFVAYMDPKSGGFKKFSIDEGTHPHNLVVDKQGTVWFTGNANGRIVKMDPATGKLTTSMMPDASIRDPHTMTFDADGDAWFTAQNAGYVGKLTRATGAIRTWRMPSGSRPYGIVLDSKGRPYFDLFGTNKIGTIDPKTGELRTYTLPNDRARPRRIEITDDHTVWYGDYTRGFLGKLNTETGAVEEFLMPEGAGSMPYGMAADDRGFIWLAETGVQPNRLVSFDPRAKKFVENIPIAADGPNTIRHMQFDRPTRQIWFADDANQIARVRVAPMGVVP